MEPYPTSTGWKPDIINVSSPHIYQFNPSQIFCRNEKTENFVKNDKIIIKFL